MYQDKERACAPRLDAANFNAFDSCHRPHWDGRHLRARLHSYEDVRAFADDIILFLSSIDRLADIIPIFHAFAQISGGNASGPLPRSQHCHSMLNAKQTAATSPTPASAEMAS